MRRYSILVTITAVLVFVIFGMITNSSNGSSPSTAGTPPRILVGNGATANNVVRIGGIAELTIQEVDGSVSLDLINLGQDSVAVYIGMIEGLETDTLTQRWQRIPIRSAAGTSTLMGARVVLQDGAHRTICNIYVGKNETDNVGTIRSSGMITQCFESQKR